MELIAQVNQSETLRLPLRTLLVEADRRVLDDRLAWDVEICSRLASTHLLFDGILVEVAGQDRAAAIQLLAPRRRTLAVARLSARFSRWSPRRRTGR